MVLRCLAWWLSEAVCCCEAEHSDDQRKDHQAGATAYLVCLCSLYVVPADERRVLGVRASHLRPHATVLKVAWACGAAFVTVSITQKGGAAGVRWC
jgi:hypothetical protein